MTTETDEQAALRIQDQMYAEAAEGTLVTADTWTLEFARRLLACDRGRAAACYLERDEQLKRLRAALEPLIETAEEKLAYDLSAYGPEFRGKVKALRAEIAAGKEALKEE